MTELLCEKLIQLTDLVLSEKGIPALIALFSAVTVVLITTISNRRIQKFNRSYQLNTYRCEKLVDLRKQWMEKLNGLEKFQPTESNGICLDLSEQLRGPATKVYEIANDVYLECILYMEPRFKKSLKAKMEEFGDLPEKQKAIWQLEFSDKLNEALTKQIAAMLNIRQQ